MAVLLVMVVFACLVGKVLDVEAGGKEGYTACKIYVNLSTGRFVS